MIAEASRHPSSWSCHPCAGSRIRQRGRTPTHWGVEYIAFLRFGVYNPQQRVGWQRNAYLWPGHDRDRPLRRHGHARARIGTNELYQPLRRERHSHTYGQGTTAHNAYGGTAYHATGSGYTTYTSASGATAYHSAYYGGTYPAYHPPVTVNNYGSGCYNCGGWSTAGAAAAGLAVGVMAERRRSLRQHVCSGIEQLTMPATNLRWRRRRRPRPSIRRLRWARSTRRSRPAA